MEADWSTLTVRVRTNVISRVLFDDCCVKSEFLDFGAGGRGFVGGASTSLEDHDGVLGEEPTIFFR